MARLKKPSKEETYDSFHCSVDSWQRDYSFGIKRWEIPGLETDKPYREMDHLVITGTVVSHDTNRKPNRRKFKTIELNLVPTHVPRDDWRKDLEAVGHAWTDTRYIAVNIDSEEVIVDKNTAHGSPSREDTSSQRGPCVCSRKEGRTSICAVWACCQIR